MHPTIEQAIREAESTQPPEPTVAALVAEIVAEVFSVEEPGPEPFNPPRLNLSHRGRSGREGTPHSEHPGRIETRGQAGRG